MEKWRRLNGEKIDQSLYDTVAMYIEREQALGNKLKICIGTDSRVRGELVEYATVIVFLREKKGGFMLINNYRVRQRMSLKERMITEVGRSVEIAYSIHDLLDKYDVGLEVHADINTDPSFRSNEALREAMGYILSMGFVFKAKPEAFASSCCADKMVN
ncbi:MAG: hypothetical protein KDC59_02180 [Saprospiraceae bacterium]|nr:hypothetical protein [Saprospiraceae bacterium]HPG05661.1 ribonuclease H-like YkuK family protein [Saprospiraceae bacterium]HQU52665.1 ribonuclease H-like YkuK family protein [Saprospiraceae bacterium]